MHRLDDATIHQFHPIVKFEIGPHHICIQPQQQSQRQKLPIKFTMTKKEIEEIINE